MLNIIEWNKPLRVNGRIYENSAAAYAALKDFDGEVKVELNFKTKAQRVAEQKQQEKEQAEKQAKMDETTYVFEIPKWLAKKKGCPMVLQGKMKKESAKAILVDAVGLVEKPTQCCVCGRELTNENSKRLGIGPICAEKAYGIDLDNVDELEKAMAEKRYELWLPKGWIDYKEVI